GWQEPASAGGAPPVRLQDPRALASREPVEERRQIVTRRPDRRVIPVDEPRDEAVARRRDESVRGPQVSVQQRLGPAERLQPLHPPGQLVAELAQPDEQAGARRAQRSPRPIAGSQRRATSSLRRASQGSKRLSTTERARPFDPMRTR